MTGGVDPATPDPLVQGDSAEGSFTEEFPSPEVTNAFRL